MHSSSSPKSSTTVTTEKELPHLPDRLDSPGLRQRIRQICIHLWIWELLSLLLCMSCVGAIIIILARYDGRPLPDWKYGLTINGVISVLAGIAKASMILPVAESISQLKWHWFWNGRSRPIMDFEYFDTASRGPWGCLMLLCRPRQWSVVTAGALVTVLALLMEPSLQFIPAYPLHSVATARASAPRSTSYKDILFGEQPDASTNGTVSIPTYGLGKATKNGYRNALYGYSENIVSPSCPTGNCTWTNFSTLGICSSCTNLTSTLRWRPFRPIGNDYLCWRLRNGECTDSYYYLDLHSAGKSDYPQSYSIAYNATTRQTVLDFYYFENSHVYTVGGTQKPKAYECALRFCVKEYSAVMQAGVYSETVVSAWPDAHHRFERHPEYEDGEDVEPAGFAIKNVTLSPPSTTENFTVDSASFAFLRSWLFQNLISGTHFNPFISNIDNGQDVAEIIFAIQKRLNGTNTSAAEVLSQRIADGLTLAIRAMADKDTAAPGAAHENRAFVKARWIFAVLPIVLVLSTCLFMATTLAITIRRGVPVWKSSALATLAHGLREESSGCITADRLDSIEHKARAQCMMVEEVGRQWRFAAVER